MDSALFASLAAVSGAAAVGVYDHLSGRDFVRDNLDRMRLRQRSLEAWQRTAEDNPRRSDVIVCMTTLPSRIAALGPTLSSLLAQTVAPARIRLHVPTHSTRERRDYDVPAWLPRLSTVQLVRTPDFGPATKLLPAIADSAPDQRLLVVDDDKLYPRDLLERFARASEREPDVAFGASGWRVPRDLVDRPTTLLSNLSLRAPTPIKATRIRTPVRVDVLQGYSGYLVRPRFFDRDALFDYASAPEAAFFVDDVWMSAHCRAPKLVLPAKRYCVPVLRHASLHARTAISRENRGNGDPRTRNNSIMLRHFASRWLVASEPAGDGS